MRMQKSAMAARGRERWMTIGRLAAAANVNVQTVRFYERTGLLAPVARSSSGYRLYGPHELRRLHFIKRAQTLGFTLNEISELLALRVQGRASCETVQAKATRKLLAVEGKIDDLRALARTLRALIKACERGQPTGQCPILESLLGEEGSVSHAVGGTDLSEKRKLQTGSV